METSELIISKVRDWVKQKLSTVESGHDWWHIHRVYQTAMHLAQSEGADTTIVALAALLHDLSDAKLTAEPEAVEDEIISFLQQNGIPQEQIGHVMHIIRNLSFRHSSSFTGTKSKEFQVVQDADRLDAIGAIGIARAFSYGGYRMRPFLNYPSRELAEKALMHKPQDGSTIGHFYEKLLLLKDMMNTDTARRLAEERHQFMLQWLDQFYKEWEGKA
ncbi:MAG TPA: HD domain-containing protein [Bacteroidales bacterium]|nr:HD domain-containing protein [Bacteroidales bacterium]